MHALDRALDDAAQAPAREPAASQLHGARPDARPPLSCGRIIDAAVRYVDANCLDELSMRRLGGELGVEAMSLYRYFPSKAALLEAVVNHVLSDVVLPSQGGSADWEAEVQAYARSFRTIAREHPNLIVLMATMGRRNRTLASIHDRMVGLWQEAGLDPDAARRTQCTLHGLLTGSSLWDAPLAPDDDGADGAPAATCATAEADFEFGLGVLLRGLREEVRAARRSA
jgi:AcrR family transcriptional regulator